MPSVKYGAEKLFNRRYLRSSYNDGGFNRAVPELIGERGADLYWVFGELVSDDTYNIKLTADSIPALEVAKVRALELAEKLRSGGPSLRVETIDAVPHLGTAEHLWQQPPNSDDALDWYRDQIDKESPLPGHGWSNAKGMFISPPGDEDAPGLKVLGAVSGVDVLNRPAVHLIYETQVGESYAESAEITAEFCEEAIELIERDGEAYIHWSG